MTTAAHRAARTPWHARAACWLYGHTPVKLAPHSWQCTRCERCAPTPVELP